MGSSSSEEPRDAYLEAIFRTQAADLYRFIYRQVQQATAAEDLTSTVFLKAIRWLQQDHSQESVKGWLYATARSLIADYWREGAQFALLPLAAAEAMPMLAGERDEQMRSLQARIQRLLDGLPARERDILTLRYLQGYSAAEIGEALGLSANHVRVLQFRALRRAALLEAEERTIPVAAPTLPYNEQALRVLEFSREEARGFHHNYVGTEHLLLGILREGSGAAELIAHDLTAERMLGGIAFVFQRVAAAGAAQAAATPPTAGDGQPDFTARTARVLVMAGEEAQRLKERAISPRHLLVAILREGQGVAAMLLQVSGVRWQEVGETLEISVIAEDEGKPITLPADLQAALQQHPEVQNLFERIAGFKQQQFVDWVEHAEGEAARRQQVEKVIEILQQARQNYFRSQGTGD